MCVRRDSAQEQALGELGSLKTSLGAGFMGVEFEGGLHGSLYGWVLEGG